MRVFRDDTGTEWTAWEVQPGQFVIGAAEQRTGRDRRVAPAPDPIIERRRGDERRVHPRRVLTLLGQELARGWLAFQAGGVRRRLSPVPAGWDQLPDANLAALCARATESQRGTPAPEAPADHEGPRPGLP